MNEKIRKTFIRLLRERRWNAEYVEHRIGWDKTRLSRLRTGKRNFTIETIDDAARLFGLKTSEFLSLAGL